MKRAINRDDVESRLDAGESLRSIARSYGISYPALQHHRRKWGGRPLRIARASGPTHASWKGGRLVEKRRGVCGYIRVRISEAGQTLVYQYEHILVAEQMLGRKLVKGELVHHINGEKTDNRPENLYVCLGHKEHRKIHSDLESLAMELVRQGKIKFSGGTYGWA